jgi:hypothetical protein
LRGAKAVETILACGHRNIQATHPTTFEITRDSNLTRKGDCIIAVSANKSSQDLSPRFKSILRQKNAKLEILIEAGRVVEVVNAFGSPQLAMIHETDMVVRKSEYVSERTLAIRADKAANELSKKLVARLKDPTQEVTIILAVKV